MIKTEGRVECPTCLGGKNPDYHLTPCPRCWGALRIPQASSPLEGAVGRLYQRLRTRLTRLTEVIRSRPDNDQAR